MSALVGYLLLFLIIPVGFVFVHLMMGKLVRPIKPDPEKLTIYECGEPTIGSAWIQFDLRFYVVALLFVIFDVEVVFFFPWAVVFGKANTLSRADLSSEERAVLVTELVPYPAETKNPRDKAPAMLRQDQPALAERLQQLRSEIRGRPTAAQHGERVYLTTALDTINDVPKVATRLAWLSFWDILVFFGVLLVGFAYLWKRGDLDWVRSMAAEKAVEASPPAAIMTEADPALAGAGRGA